MNEINKKELDDYILDEGKRDIEDMDKEELWDFIDGLNKQIDVLTKDKADLKINNNNLEKSYQEVLRVVSKLRKDILSNSKVIAEGTVNLFDLKNGDKFILNDSILTIKSFNKRFMPTRGKVLQATAMDQDGNEQWLTRNWKVKLQIDK